MDQVEELLAAIDDGKVASQAEILPDEPARRALWLAQEMPKWTWLRRIVQETRESFVPGGKRRSKGKKGCGTDWQSAGDSAATESRITGESRDGSSATESRDTMDLLSWGKTYLPEHFLKPPSVMHQWMAEMLAGTFDDELGNRLPVERD